MRYPNPHQETKPNVDLKKKIFSSRELFSFREPRKENKVNW